MKAINTLKGPMDAQSVNVMCPHEHLFLDMTHEAVAPKTEKEKELFYSEIRMKDLGVLRRNPYIMRTNLILDNVEDAVHEMEGLSEYGCNLLLDLTSVGLGRNIGKLLEVSARTDVNLTAGCGLFVHDALPRAYQEMDTADIAAWMMDEITNGIDETGVKPGVIGEIGTSEVIYPIEERSLKAAAIANQKTGLPIFIHTYPWSRAGLDAVTLLRRCGVMPENICICHLDVTFDLTYIQMALEQGVYIEFDNFGKEFYFESQDAAFSGGPFETDVARVRLLKGLIQQGYVDKVLLANDLCLKASLHKYGGWGYDHVFKNIIPMMRMEGIGKKEINTMVVENPKRFLFDPIQ